MKASEILREVEDKERHADDRQELEHSWIVEGTQGLGEKVTLTTTDIGHLWAGGVIIVPINGYEYCLLICFEEPVSHAS